MRITSPVITMDVDIEEIIVRNNNLVLSGFAGVEEIEAQVSAHEAISLMFKLMRFSILTLLVRSIFSRRK